MDTFYLYIEQGPCIEIDIAGFFYQLSKTAFILQFDGMPAIGKGLVANEIPEL